MPAEKTVTNWNFPQLGYSKDEEGNVAKIWCKICREIFRENEQRPKYRGFITAEAETYIAGTSVVKKNNFRDHLSSNMHKTAMSRLAEAASDPCANTVQHAEDVPKQVPLLPRCHRLPNSQRLQLTKKFQTAHFTFSKVKSFKFYEDICVFNKGILQVDLGDGYLGRKSASEMVHCLSKSSRMKQITEPVNNGKIRYFSILCDGISSTRTVDKKELYLLKSANLGTVKFSVISLEQPEETTAAGLKQSLDKALSKMNFTVPRQEKEVGMCTDGASVNIALHRLVREEIGDHHTLVLCPSHGVELAIRDAFKQSTFDIANQKNLALVYYFFKRANIRWRLFKRQAILMEYRYHMYKRPNGGPTQWTEHQVGSLSSYLHNLPVLVAFFNQQIESPHNKSMTDIRVTLTGLQRQICSTDELISASAKHDLLSILVPVTKELQNSDLIAPELLSKCKVAMNTLQKLKLQIFEKRAKIFEECPLFPQTKAILSQLFPVRDTVTRNRQTISASELHCVFYGYMIQGNIEVSKENVTEEIDNIVEKLIESLWIRLSNIIDNKLLNSMSIFLDTKSYIYYEAREIASTIDVIVQQFESLLRANDCRIDRLHHELEVMHEYVKAFTQQKESKMVWPQLFANQLRLGIANVLHIAELCLVFPLSNAGSERVFSFLWRVLSKERQSLSNNTLENILRLRCDNDFSPDRYRHAIDIFLAEYPNGVVQKRKRRPKGITQSSNKRRASTKTHSIDLTEISDDLWSTSSTSDENEFLGF